MTDGQQDAQSLDAESVVEFVVKTLVERRPDWTEAQIREMVGHAERYIAMNPGKFIDAFLDNMNALEGTRV